jgi:hypothetical protein
MLRRLASRLSVVPRSLLSTAALVLAGGLAAAGGCGGGGTGGTTTGQSGGGGFGTNPPTSSGNGGTTDTSTGGGTPITGTGGSAGTGGAGGGGGGMPQCVGPIHPDVSGKASMKLADTGLYDDIANGVVSANAKPYAPAYTLWADDAGKNRWAYIPPSCPIDNTDEDHWAFPVGTRFWKEFAVGAQKIETRMIEHYGPGPTDWLYVTYQWNQAGTDATLVPISTEVDDVYGTDHDIPAWPGQCLTCHGTNEKDHVNGFQAIQLSGGATGLNLAALAAAGLLKVAPPGGGYPVPGDATSQAALGYLHANCGHCHNDVGMQQNGALRMRLKVADTDPTMTDTYLTAVNQPSQHCVGDNRITPMDHVDSCIFIRMSSRGDPAMVPYQASADQMPPVATKFVDTNGLAAVQAWIDSL